MDFFHQWRDILLPLLIFLGVIIIRQISQMFKARHLKDIAAMLNGEVVIRPFSYPRIKGMYMGMPYQIAFAPEGRGSPGSLVVTFEYPCPFVMEVRPKGEMPRLVDFLPRGKVVRSGNESFDEQFLFRAERDPEKAEHYLGNKINQERLREAFQKGFVLIKYSGKGITLSRPGNFLRSGVTSDELTNCLAFAARLGERF